MFKFAIHALAAGAIASGVLLVIKKGPSPTLTAIAIAGALGHLGAHYFTVGH